MKPWMSKAMELLAASLEPPRHELNELDWKTTLSPDKKRLTEHLAAMANLPGGGYLVFGIDNTGAPAGLQQSDCERIVGQVANLGREALEPRLALDHGVEAYRGVRLLFVHVPESAVKPVHLRGRGMEDTFIRSGGTTRDASRQEVGTLLLHSHTPRWEELPCSRLLPDDELIAALNAERILGMVGRPLPSTSTEQLDWMAGEGFISREPGGGGYITNLGAISAAKALGGFSDLSRKAVRIVAYDGLNKAKTKIEREGTMGYAVSFQGILNFTTSLLPQSEVIQQALRVTKTVYPEIALREIIANALIHQDFSVTGAGPLIEIYDDRLEISNPGGLLPSKRLDRLIGTQPESRNEQLARAFRRYKICEERGSGLLKAGLEVELYGLPPIQFDAGPAHFKVTLFRPRTFVEMASKERLNACYQHAVLRHFSGGVMTNASLRERLKVSERQRSAVSQLIQEAIDKKLIKPADPENKSRKYAEYIPHWA